MIDWYKYKWLQLQWLPAVMRDKCFIETSLHIYQAKWRDMVVLKFGHKLLSPNSPCGHYQLSLVSLIIKPLEIDMNVSSSISICAGSPFWCILETSWNYDLVICVLGILFLFGFCLGSVCPSKTVPRIHHCRCRWNCQGQGGEAAIRWADGCRETRSPR